MLRGSILSVQYRGVACKIRLFVRSQGPYPAKVEVKNMFPRKAHDLEYAHFHDDSNPRDLRAPPPDDHGVDRGQTRVDFLTPPSLTIAD